MFFTNDNLMEELRSYRCLYDKCCEVYRDKFKKQNAWQAVANEIGADVPAIQTWYRSDDNLASKDT